MKYVHWLILLAILSLQLKIAGLALFYVVLSAPIVMIVIIVDLIRLYSFLQKKLQARHTAIHETIGGV